jgi:hypothetical protein
MLRFRFIRRAVALARRKKAAKPATSLQAAARIEESGRIDKFDENTRHAVSSNRQRLSRPQKMRKVLSERCQRKGRDG